MNFLLVVYAPMGRAAHRVKGNAEFRIQNAEVRNGEIPVPAFAGMYFRRNVPLWEHGIV